MDILTLAFLGTILMGLMAGDAVISSNTMTVNVGLPPIVLQSGLTRAPAEEIFVTELARITALPSALPVPMPRVGSRRTVIGALAEPLKLTELTAALQDLFGLEPIRISATMLQVEAGLSMEVVVAQQGRPPRHMRLSHPNLDAVTLLRRAARESFAEVAPYRVTLARLNAQLDGSETNLSEVRAATNAMLARTSHQADSLQHSALFSLASVLSLLEGDAAQAAREVRMANSYSGVLASARAFYAFNGAFLSILAGDLEQARVQTERGIAASPGHPVANMPSYVAIQRGLLAWAEGQRETALQRMQDALQLDPANRNAQIYAAWLRHLNSGAPGRFDPASLPEPLSRSPMVPGLMASVFLQDPMAREVQRAPMR
jgi:hypothetical protein